MYYCVSQCSLSKLFGETCVFSSSQCPFSVTFSQLSLLHSLPSLSSVSAPLSLLASLSISLSQLSLLLPSTRLLFIFLCFSASLTLSLLSLFPNSPFPCIPFPLCLSLPLFIPLSRLLRSSSSHLSQPIQIIIDITSCSCQLLAQVCIVL